MLAPTRAVADLKRHPSRSGSRRIE